MTRVFVEVTDTIGAAYTSGLQRHTRGVVNAWLDARAEEGDTWPELVPVVWDLHGRCLRRLTPEERDRLTVHHHGEPRPPRPLPLPAGWQAPVRRLANRRSVRRLRAEFRRIRTARTRSVSPDLLLPHLPAGSVLLEVEAGWQSLIDREHHFGRATADGARVVALVADVMPILFPEWFPEELHDPFAAWTRAVIRHADTVVCISDATAADVATVARRWGLPEPRTARTTLGADLPQAGDDTAAPTAPFERYLVDVATVEPRKDPLTLLEAWETLRADHPDLGLVFVGRLGWGMDDAVARIEGHPEFGRLLLWRRDADDAELMALLRAATLAVQPSRYEGFGLPVVEALALGCPVVTTTGGALPEAGGGLAEYVTPGDVDALAATIRRHLEDPEHHRAVRARIAGFHAPRWRDTARAVADACEPADR